MAFKRMPCRCGRKMEHCLASTRCTVLGSAPEKHGIVISNKDALILDGEEKEEAERRIAELDQKVEELSQLMDKTTDETEKARLLDELMQTYRETNRWLCAIGADESQMYDI